MLSFKSLFANENFVSPQFTDVFITVLPRPWGRGGWGRGGVSSQRAIDFHFACLVQLKDNVQDRGGHGRLDHKN